MVHIVTGNINSYKTTKMIKLYHRYGGDGVVSVKNMIGTIVHSYDAMHLKTSVKTRLIVRDEFVTPDFVKESQIGPYMVSKDAIKVVNDLIHQMIQEKVEPIFLDEIGQLECDGYGFASVFSELVASNLELFISVRTDLVEHVIKTFHIKDYQLIE